VLVSYFFSSAGKRGCVEGERKKDGIIEKDGKPGKQVLAVV
jgi:hypothetical protein